MSKYALQLYINGKNNVSVEAVDILNTICREKLNGEYYLEIIDIQEHPDRAEEEGIMAIPTLIRKWPLPVTRLIGALTVRSRVLAGLGLSSLEPVA
ncbi:circadian clock KaiB family protein [Hymenobacter sp. H14-R3]|uniref:circadian clock KaiB family protein n=1 Tax=Hymenobacter sp. H14-R3 TaxID=3046308 RepID=UPI0024B95394|nr:circadian clock KaiB family protein [Hymenobacter sp. H14-R3]MDJ0367008.1 circadian clock KaiB family protein [Hymenobacter sp. H14-R3]